MHADRLEELAVRLQNAHDEVGVVRRSLATAKYDDVASTLMGASIALGRARLELCEEIRDARDDNS